MNWTLDIVQNLQDKGKIRGYVVKGCPQKLLGQGKKKSKYGNEKVEIDGFVFDSIKESKRYGELKIMRKAGLISYLEVHKVFELVVEGKLVAKYESDFSYYTKEGEYVVEDVKSDMTRKLPVYRLKKKLMQSIYGIEITEK